MAEKRLDNLESDVKQQEPSKLVVQTLDDSASTVTTNRVAKTVLVPTPQMELFSEPSPVQNYVTNLNPDDITPRDALKHLYELKALISSPK